MKKNSVILIDVNLLIYASVTGAAQHDRAQEWLDGQLSGGGRVGLPWETLSAYLRLTTNPRAFARPMSIESSWSLVGEWLSLPNVWIPLPTESHRDLLGGLLPYASHRNVTDAHLAALAMSHGLTLMSADAGFARFPDLKWENPLAA